MASADLREELDCSICLNLYTDPVTLRCGHNFCRGCIDQFLDTQDGSGVYSCPECRAEFRERPALQKNINLHNVEERFLSTQPHREEITGICCTYCVDSPVPAVRSCLLCEASLCDKHLKVHSKEAEHVLTKSRTSLENRKCPIHKKVLDYYCTEDSTCICVSCSLAGEHRGHQVKMLDEASEEEKKKKKRRNVLQNLITKREKTEEGVQGLLKHWKKALVTCLQTISPPKPKRPRGPADVLLDVNTANNYLLISDDLKTVTWTGTKQNRPETAERFKGFDQVMSSEGFSSGRHYWDVEMRRSTLLWVGMCYPSIDRTGRQPFPGNNKSWGFNGGEWLNWRYTKLFHKIFPLPNQIFSNRYRIYLDYEAGQLSFYELCDPIRHFHTFLTTFTEPLHAALCVCEGSIKILGGEAAVTGVRKPSMRPHNSKRS